MERVVATRTAPIVGAVRCEDHSAVVSGTWMILRHDEPGEWRSVRRALDFPRLYSGPRAEGPSHPAIPAWTIQPPIIRVEHLVKQFGDVVAVDDVSFDVRRGEIFAFLGPNGAGKTTTIRMLTTLLAPTGGTLELDGLDPVHQQNAVRQRIGVVFQDPSLDQDLTAWENLDLHGVLYGVPRARAARARAAAARAVRAGRPQGRRS